MTKTQEEESLNSKVEAKIQALADAYGKSADEASKIKKEAALRDVVNLAKLEASKEIWNEIKDLIK